MPKSRVDIGGAARMRAPADDNTYIDTSAGSKLCSALGAACCRLPIKIITHSSSVHANHRALPSADWALFETAAAQVARAHVPARHEHCRALPVQADHTLSILLTAPCAITSWLVCFLLQNSGLSVVLLLPGELVVLHAQCTLMHRFHCDFISRP